LSKSGNLRNVRLVNTISGYLELIRPHNLIASALTSLIGNLSVLVYIKNYYSNYNNDVLTLTMFTMLSVILIAAGGYSINDYFDAEVDAINKPYRPIPSGRVSKDHALVYSIILFTLGLIISLTLGLAPFILAFINTALLLGYSYKIKVMGIYGNIVISYLGASSILFGSLVIASHVGMLRLVWSSFIPSLFAFFLLLGREIVKTVEDVKADRIRGVKSLPALLGIRRGLIISLLPLAIVILVSPIPSILMNYGPIYIVNSKYARIKDNQT